MHVENHKRYLYWRGSTFQFVDNAQLAMGLVIALQDFPEARQDLHQVAGMTKTEKELLLPILERHAAALNPDWKTAKLLLTDVQQFEIEAELRMALALL